MQKNKRLSLFVLRPVCVAMVLAWATPAAWALDPGALPVGGVITAGDGSVAVDGRVMTVQQGSDRLITNWQQFNIGSDAAVRFLQPGASSVALNRVLGGEASQIFGQLSANGQVFLVNPNGVFFAPGASVDAGGIVASSLGIKDADFLAGRHVFEGSGGSVVNAGRIQAGKVALLGAKVVNSGQIQSPNGAVGLAAGDKVTLDFEGDGLIRMDVDRAALGAEVANQGAIAADGGTVLLRASAVGDLYATVVSNSGIVRARSLTQRDGVVILDGGQSGVVHHAGVIDVSGIDGASKGGRASVLGDKVAITGQVDARGAQGGGTILLGGAFQGKGSERNASATYVDQSARLEADATAQGDGGTIVVWSDGGTRFHGSASARGAGQGNGGMVETSGKEWLEVRGSVDASAAQGRAGTWLLDPRNVTISNSATASGGFSSGDPSVFNPTGNNATVHSGDIENSLNNGTSVVITTGSSGTQSGDITVSAGTSIRKTAGDDAALTLQAARHIIMDGSIESTSGKLDVILNARSEGGSTGYVSLTGATIRTNGGNLVIGGGSDPSTGYAIGAASGTTQGVKLSGVTLSTGAGDITINGQGGTSAASGVNLAGGATNLIETDSGNLRINGKSTTGHAVLIQSGDHTFRTGSGDLTIAGETAGGGNGAVRIGSGATTALFETDSGRVILEGTNTGANGTGVWVDSGSLSFRTGQAGGIVLRGIGDGDAVRVIGANLQAGQQGIRIEGQGQNPTASGNGQVSLSNTQMQTQGGNVHISADSHIVFGSAGAVQVTTQGGDIVLQARSRGAANGYVDLSQVSLQSEGGDITVGGGSDPLSSYAVGASSGVTNGVRLRDALLSSGAGNITINGQSGTAAASGVNLAGGFTNLLETGSGNLRINGKSTTGHAVLIQSGDHTFRTGSGDLTIAGETAGGGNGAVRIGSGATTALFETDSGRVILEGSNTGANGAGVWVDSGSLSFRTGQAGGIVLRGIGDGDAVRVIGANLQAGQQGIRIEGQGQNATASGNGQVSLSDTQMQTQGGNVHVSAGSHIIFDRLKAVSVTTHGGDIVLQTRSQGADTGYADLRSASLISDSGNIIIGGGQDPSRGYAIGAATGVTNGVRFGDTTLRTGSGNITVSGQGGTAAASGVSLANSSTNTIASSSGNILLRGASGAGAGSGSGIIVQTGDHTISSDSGNITLEGEADGSGTAVRIGTTSGAVIRMTTQGGDIAVTGKNTGSGDAVSIGAGDIEIAAGGRGALRLEGQAVEGAGVTVGPVGSATTTVLRTEGGDMHLLGQSKTGNGVVLHASASSSEPDGRGRAELRSVSGNILMTGVSESGIGVRNSPASSGDTYVGSQQGDIRVTGVSASDLGLEIYPVLSTSAGREGSAVWEVGKNGNISLFADTMSFAGPRTLINGGGVLTVAPTTPGKRVGFGTGAEGDLALSNFNLQSIGEDWARIVVGSPQADWVEIGGTLPENIKVVPQVVNRHQFAPIPSPQEAAARAAVQAAEDVTELSLQPSESTLAERLERDAKVLTLSQSDLAVKPALTRSEEVDEDGEEDEEEEENSGE